MVKKLNRNRKENDGDTMANFDFFINERMKVLIELYKHQINLSGKMISPISQQEIAELIKCSKVKVNQIIKELIEHGFVETYNSKGRYILTDKAIKVIQLYIEL